MPVPVFGKIDEVELLRSAQREAAERDDEQWPHYNVLDAFLMRFNACVQCAVTLVLPYFN